MCLDPLGIYIYIYINVLIYTILSMSCASGVYHIYSMCDQSHLASFDSGIKGALTYMECANNWDAEMG